MNQADAIRPIRINLHFVDILLMPEKAIDLPGCAGVVPIFINSGFAYLYQSGLPEPENYNVRKWEGKHHDSDTG